MKKWFRELGSGLCIASGCIIGSTAVAQEGSGAYNTGFYAGVTGGMNRIKADFKQPASLKNSTVGHREGYGGSAHKNTFQGGAFIGFLMRGTESNFAFAVEPYLLVRSAKMEQKWENSIIGKGAETKHKVAIIKLGTHTHTTKLKYPMTWGINFKAGIICREEYFLYGLIGVSQNRASLKHTVQENWSTESGRQNASFETSKKKRLWGMTYGAGIERAFEKVRLGAEVTYTRSKRLEVNQRREGYNETAQAKAKGIWGFMVRVAIPF